MFYNHVRRPEAASHLALLYFFLDPYHTPCMRPLLIGNLDITEALVPPEDGFYEQVKLALKLEASGGYMIMDPAQVYALHLAMSIWPDLQHMCGYCFQRSEYRQLCKGCKCVFYCNRTCRWR